MSETGPRRRALFGVDMKITGADGRDLPWDDKSAGDLHVAATG